MLIHIKNFFKKIYQSVVVINDTPHRIAGGFALGVFLGIVPGAGPMASLVMAYVLQVNRAAALAGSLLTNSWFSVVTFVFAVKIGAFVTGSSWKEIYDHCKNLLDHFHWKLLTDGSTWLVLKPVLVGYAIIGAIAGCVVYLCSLMVVAEYRRRKKKFPTKEVSP